MIGRYDALMLMSLTFMLGLVVGASLTTMVLL